ncbi:hypothetical protein FACS1894195_0180 [Bacteroidia bacterium]|nr:hypothetical protein FACS1894195_0180 [Bacteroidia bacterium]
MPRKDKNITPSVTQKLQTLGYNVADWDDSQTASKMTAEVADVLSTASKSGNGNQGFPDRIYVNAHQRLLVLVEEKPTVKEHDNSDVEKGAISGIKWYLSRFFNSNLKKSLSGFFDNWKILGIAVSGDLLIEYQHKFSCYTIDVQTDRIISLPQVTNFMTKEQFLSLFNSLDEEKAVTIISSSSKKINNFLRSVDSQKRPVLLSALIICMHHVKQNSENYFNDFPEHYKTYSPKSIITNVLDTVENVLRVDGIPAEKLLALKTELAFLTTDQTLNNSTILKDILIELETSVIPLFNNNFATNSNYDIIGKFYEEFLKYAGVSNVKKGIVLTPRHITTLFTKLIDLKDNDKIVDICCGTGAFLISGMNALVNKISKSDRTDKDTAIANVKENQLLGFELNTTMYICAVSNMLFRGDGKSSIYNYDSINNPKAQEIFNNFGATVGFINPPYSGKENKENPTPKEITFLTKLLDNCSRYGVIIAPLSTYFKEENVREAILKKHTLKYVINMPPDLFMPNAATNTAIAVFETNRSFDYQNDEVVFYDLREDGFVLSKNKGRTDVYGRWESVEKELLKALKPVSVPNDITLVRCKIKPKDEWTIYAHSKTDYSTLCEGDFINSIADYMIFQAKKDLDILNTDLTESELFLTLNSYFKNEDGVITKNKRNSIVLDFSNWKEFEVHKLFEVTGTKTTPLYDLETMYGQGDYPYITTRATNNGVAGYYDHTTEKGNILVADSAVIGYVSYQAEDFSASDHVELLMPKFELNKYIAMFLRTVFMKGSYKYAYGRKFNQDRIRATKLLLPAISDSEPDWQFMENYIKSLPYSDNI